MRRLLTLSVAVMLAACAMTEPSRPKIIVFFQHDSTRLDAAAQAQIGNAAREAAASPSSLLTVAGFAAANGSLDADQRLAASRAQLVSALLQQDGVSASRIEIIPRPPSNEDETVGARRVEISIGDPAAS